MTALRAFEAAARHMSFANAAKELHVTPAALSFQIKSLEEHLGAPLFHRLNRAVELTAAGRTLAPGASEGFEKLHTAWRAAKRLQDSSRLTVTAGPAFTAKWFAPRLFKFAQAHPSIEMRFSTSLQVLDFDRDEIDVAIRFGVGPQDGLFSQIVIDEWLTPMMSPTLAEQFQDPGDLQNAPLLHMDWLTSLSRWAHWDEWFHRAGLGRSPRGGVHFTQDDHAIDAAIAGAGIVLGRISLAEGALNEGSLVAPFTLALKTDANYRFVCPQSTKDRPQNRAFLDWIMSEAQSLEAFRADKKIVDVTGEAEG